MPPASRAALAGAALAALANGEPDGLRRPRTVPSVSEAECQASGDIGPSRIS